MKRCYIACKQTCACVQRRKARLSTSFRRLSSATLWLIWIQSIRLPTLEYTQNGTHVHRRESTDSDQNVGVFWMILGISSLFFILIIFWNLILSFYSQCCLCAVLIDPNPSNMCVNCLKSNVDISEGIPKQAVLYFCKGCERLTNRCHSNNFRFSMDWFLILISFVSSPPQIPSWTRNLATVSAGVARVVVTVHQKAQECN